MDIAQNIENLKKSINAVKIAAKRFDKILLLAVSKKQSIDAIHKAYLAGIRDFGENYVQEASLKIQSLSHLLINWHFIGQIQSNKINQIARFDWIHSLCELKHVSLLNTEAQRLNKILQVCIQINLDDEAQKAGVKTSAALDFVRQMQEYPNLKIRGLMAIPKLLPSFDLQYESLLRLKHLKDLINNRLDLNLDTLSMGMSQDFEAAIYAGSTILRIGEAIFGKRQ